MLWHVFFFLLKKESTTDFYGLFFYKKKRFCWLPNWSFLLFGSMEIEGKSSNSKSGNNIKKNYIWTSHGVLTPWEIERNERMVSARSSVRCKSTNSSQELDQGYIWKAMSMLYARGSPLLALYYISYCRGKRHKHNSCLDNKHVDIDDSGGSWVQLWMVLVIN